MSAGLDLVGIVDPTGVADAANAALQFKNGDYWGAGASVLGVIPYAGDLVKVGKVGRDVRIISGAIGALKVGDTIGTGAYRAFTARNFRTNLVRRTGMNPKGKDAHHLLPKKFSDPLSRKGINVNDPRYGRWVNHSNHNKTWKKYNDDFEIFLKENDGASEEDVINFAESLMYKYELY